MCLQGSPTCSYFSRRASSHLTLQRNHKLTHSTASSHPAEAPVSRPVVDSGKRSGLIDARRAVYCLARSIERREKTPRPLHFWRDRFLRIYLTYWAALATAILFALATTPFNGLPARSAIPDSPFAWLADLSLTHVWVRVHPKMVVSWSHAYELGFYLLVGAVLLPFLRGPRRRFVLAASLTAITCLTQAPQFLPLLGLWPNFACGLAVHAALSSKLPARFETSLSPILRS